MSKSAMSQLTTNSDVQVIREILFGEQSQRIQENFARLDELIASLQQENQQLRLALEAESHAREKDTQARVRQIEETQSRIQAQIKALHEQFDRNLEQEAGARQEAIAGLELRTGERFQEMSKEHAQQMDAVGEKHQADMRRLVSLLASALAEYQEQAS